MGSRVEGITPVRQVKHRRKVSPSFLLGLVLLVVSTLGGYAYLSGAGDSRGVLVAARDLPAGAVLGPNDLVEARMRLDDAVYDAALPAAALGEVIGRPLAAPAYAYQVLVRQHVTSRPLLGADQLAMTVAVKAEAAANGRIKAGDLVAVLVTTEKGRPTTQSSLVLERVMVLDIGYDERLRGVSSGASDAGERENMGPLASVTLAVSREQALQLARAKHNGELDVALLGGGR